MVEQIEEMLGKIQQSLFESAKQKRDTCVQIAKTWDEFVEALGQKKLILAPWCDEEVFYQIIQIFTNHFINIHFVHVSVIVIYVCMHIFD